MVSGNMGHVITMREPGQVTTKVLVAIMPVVGRRLYSLMTIDHNHHDDICQICLHRSQYTHQQNFICKVSFTYCLFLQILFCFLSQIFEIRSVCIDLRVGFAKHTETTFAFMAPLFAFHFASCNPYICILE